MINRRRLTNSFRTICISLFLFLNVQLLYAQKTVDLFCGKENPKVQFAIDELKLALSKRNYEVQVSDLKNAGIVLLTGSDLKNSGTTGQTFSNPQFQLKPEGFYIQKNEKGQIGVIGADDAGLMYGGLELAEQIRIGGLKGIQKTEQNPYMEVRGAKYNIPLDARTPSYSDLSDVFQANIPEVWNFGFWQEYIDNLARNRYNLICLWNLHPFPSMVKVPEYPDVALNDVYRSTAKFKEYYNGNGLGFDAIEILANPEVVKKITIDEKILFWKKVMKYAKDRNIGFYIMTWNIFVNGAAGKYGITDKVDNPVTQDYMRQSVKQMLLTYPDLAGIGLTTGENMPESTSEEKEDWAFKSYGLGFLDATKENPNRKFTIIHRQHQTGAQEIAKTFSPLIENKNIEFLFSFKYAQAHAMSSTTQTFHTRYVKDIKGMKTMWTLRNDDNYYFRWGAPDFVREFIKNIPMEVTKGFYYGSDQYVWGRDFLSRDPGNPRRLENERHWYHWMLWGRLSYNPDLGNDRFVQLIENRFPGVDGKKLFEAWQEASMIYPKTTGFHWGEFDFQWYIEGCRSNPVFSENKTGFHDVNRFISLPPHPGTGYQSIPDYVKTIVSKEKPVKITPLEVSRQIHAHSDKALQLVEQIKAGNNKELSNTLEDIHSMAWLGKYYAYKISGATALALFRETGDKKYQAEAVEQLTKALDYWIKYYENAIKQYKNPLWTNRVGYVDWVKLTDEVKWDIEIAKREQFPDVKSRLVIMADMGNEPDEMQQNMHLLMYNNEFDLEGLFAVTGKWLRPDFENEPYRQKLHPELFDTLINGYSKVFKNLKLHANGWHTPEYLRSIVKSGQTGYGIDAVGDGKTSQGSEYLTELILKNDLRPVYIVINAGSNTLAQALWDYHKNHTKAEMDAFVAKLIIYDNGAQDDAGGWILSQFPDIHWVRSTNQKNAFGGNTGKKSDNNIGLGPWAWKPFPKNEEGAHAWAKENIQTGHGAFGALYPDRYMETKFWFIEGGGTIPWLGLVSHGLYDPMHQNWGGYSGRYTAVKKAGEWSVYPEIALREKEKFGKFLAFTDTSDFWIDPSDRTVYNNINTPVHRWRQVLFDDFKCRMDWCLESYEKSNHNPVAVLDLYGNHTIISIDASPGEELTFNASKSFDPDKNQKLTFSWWIYPEAGNYPGNISLENPDQDKLVFKVPENAKNKQIHLILDVSDNSSIAPLHDFRRIVISVK
jgi:hypothetical protein